MADDLDSLDDLFGDEPVKKGKMLSFVAGLSTDAACSAMLFIKKNLHPCAARAVGKHRPKPKLQPQRKAAAKCSVTSTQAVQTVQSAPSDSREPLETGKPLELS